MEGQTLLFFKLTLLIIDEWDKLRIALSGIVLIKIKYALANAGDVTRIPQDIFKTNCKAMFLASQNTPWFVKPASYVTHPEYEYSTLNSIAVVELNLDEVDDFPLTPLCLPTADTFSASRYLYLTGFTDDNQILEKVIYKIQYVDNKVCEEFHNRAVVPSQQLIPSAYLCGYTPNIMTKCVWENGMVLVSNATGYYNLIGFGIHGPGCAAPARFINLFPYFSWIKSVTTPDDVYRRKEDANKFIPNTPIHDLYTMKGSRRTNGSIRHDFERYPFDVDTLQFHLIEPSKDDNNTLLIIPFKGTWQEHEDACSEPSIPMYSEYFELKTRPWINKGFVTYKLSLYDLAYATCSCVRLTINSDEQSDAILAFKEQINFKEHAAMSEHSGETPEELFRYFPVHERKENPEEKVKFEDNEFLSYPIHVRLDDIFPKEVKNYDLYIKFEFTEWATMKFVMFAEPLNDTVVLETTTSTSTEPTVRRRAKSSVKKRPKSLWGTGNWADKMLKEAEVSLVADVEEVQETESAARSEGTPGAMVVACWLVIACLRRAFFIY